MAVVGGRDGKINEAQREGRRQTEDVAETNQLKALDCLSVILNQK